MAYTTINKPNTYFNTVTYTGNGSTQSITGVGFKPDLIWGKARGATSWHNLTDAVRGVSKPLFSNTTNAEANYSGNQFTSFNTDGFTVVDDSVNTYGCNGTGYTYVSWNWLGANTTVSNTQGSITSTVSANTTSGFSIVTFSGNGVNGATVGHGLGVTPKMIIIKNRSTTTAWLVQHIGLSGLPKANSTTLTLASSNTNGLILLNTNESQITYGFDAQINGSGNNMIAYCFAEVKGFSKFGSYVGNGSTDGTFVYTGFKPAMVIAKASSTTGQWSICDNRRGTANTANGEFLFAESSEALNAATNNWDFLSNGFKARANYAAHNTSGVTYIYAAFAENPLVGTNNVPATAR